MASSELAFTVAGKLVVVVEHQSTINENMLLRLLLYVACIYEKLVAKDSIYYHRLITIPRLDFLVLYNGTAPYPDEATLSLSDAFMDELESIGSLGGSLELMVRVYRDTI